MIQIKIKSENKTTSGVREHTISGLGNYFEQRVRKSPFLPCFSVTVWSLMENYKRKMFHETLITRFLVIGQIPLVKKIELTTLVLP